MKKHHIKISLLSIAVLTFLITSPSCGVDSDGKEEGNAEEVAGHHEGHENHEEHDHEEHDHEVDEHVHDHSGMIKLDDHKAKEYGVVTQEINSDEFSDVLLVSGRIESKASDEVVATATRSGILTLSPNINTGVKVGAGTSIGLIHSSNVQGSDPTGMAVAARDAAKRELDRLTPLHKDGIVSTQVYNNALATYEQAEAALRNSRQGSGSVVSPKGGVITQLFARSGEYVEAGQRVAVVSANTNLTLRADVPEKYINHISGIETANFRPASSSSTFSLGDLGGRIISNTSSVVAQNGYVPIYFSFENNGSVTPGAFAEVYLMSGARHGVLSVPKEAVVEINGNKCIYTRHGKGLYEKHVVALGASDGLRVEILSGLEAGEDVVVKGSQIVRMAETSATAVPGHTHHH